MASVSSLDKDLRRLRLDKYTPAAANEVRSWIEGILGEKLPGSDLLEGLKNGVALCKLVNLAIGPPGVKFKQSAMPFVQMENVSHFLRACQLPPLNLQQHDMFLTVDLYEQKDPAQVLQCLSAFSRAANRANPTSFPSPIGSKPSGNNLTPQHSGLAPGRSRGLSNASNSSSAYGSRTTLAPARTGDSNSERWSPNKSPSIERVGSPSVSSWSKRDHEGVTSPAWNIAQYGYMGGASQGNLGIAFGGRRQITSAGPQVPNKADKLRRQQVEESDSERQRLQMEEEEHSRKAQLKAAEQTRWEEESRRQREEEKCKAEEEKRRWEEEERQWRLTEEKRRQEEEAAEARLAEERKKARNSGSSQLRGQTLSQYQAEQGLVPQKSDGGYVDRIKQLEEELELAREREREYEEERQRRGGGNPKGRRRSKSRARLPASPPSRQDSWSRDEREVLRTQWDRHQEELANRGPAPSLPSRPLPDPKAVAPMSPPRMGHGPASSLPARPQETAEAPPLPMKPQLTGEARPLPVPGRVSDYGAGGYSVPPVKSPAPASSSNSRPLPPNPASASRTDRFLAVNKPPAPAPTHQTYSRELGATAEQDDEDRRRLQSQNSTKAAGWAGKSLLEREMEMERQRQQEWEEAQKETANAARSGNGVDGIGGGIDGRWDVGQWSGYTGGDNQNNVGTGIGAGRRQIVGARPLPKLPGEP